MSYVIPSVLVYQQLENSGGVANSTPDLPACIVGPCFSETKYDAGSIESLVASAAKSAVSTTGSIVKGTKEVIVASISGFSVGDDVVVDGAGSKKATLSAKVTAVQGASLILDASALTTVSDVSVYKKGRMTNPLATSVYALPNTKPGQVVDPSSLQVWLNDVVVETLSTKVVGYSALPSVTPTSVSTTGSITAGSHQVTLASSAGLVRGDSLAITGAGEAGSTLVAEVVSIVGPLVSISVNAVTTVASVQVVKQSPAAIGVFSNTVTVSAGDEAVLSYVNTSGASKTFTTKVRSAIADSVGVTALTFVDGLPADFSKSTVGTATGGQKVISVTSADGLVANAKAVLSGEGGEIPVTVQSVSGLNVTLVETIVTGGTYAVSVENSATLFIQKKYSNQLVPAVSYRSNSPSLDLSTIVDTSTFSILPGLELTYGYVLSADVHAGYRALRKDLSGSVLEIANADDLVGVLGNPTDTNPLSLGVQVALANTTGSVFAMAVDSDDLLGYQEALDMSEGHRLYGFVPLSQKTEVLGLFKTHVSQMSTPENASWRAAILNTPIPDYVNVGPYSADYVNGEDSNVRIVTVGARKVLQADNATFVSDGVTPGDLVNITEVVGEEAGSEPDGNGPPGLAGKYTVLEVVSNTSLVLDCLGEGPEVYYYISRKLTKTQKADHVALTSEQFGTNRVLHVQPDVVGVSVNGVTKYLPGYYLCCAIAGMTAGFPAQQGFTNIGLAGITDLKNSNFYFTRSQMNRMAEKGTFLIVQDTQGGLPYVRHELTTDMSVLEYREFLVVKNWDFLSYYFHDKMKPFIGSWNITPDTVTTMRQTMVASAELLKKKKLPKIGAPLVDFQLTSIAQDATNKDNVNITLKIAVVYPNNYTNIYLVI